MRPMPRVPALLQLLAIAAAPACATHATPPAGLPRLGTNLDPISDWGTMLPFTDVFKTSRPWISGNLATWQWDDGRPLDLDARGWVRSLLPNQVARTLMLVEDVTLHVGAGRYVVTYDGSGELWYENQATLVSHAPGRDVIDVHAHANGGIFLSVVATSPSNPLRNVRVVPEADAASPEPPTFTDEFLARLEPYGVLRFMDWGMTNGSPLAHWGDRPVPADARWSTEKGVPIEVMVDLANATCAEPWFCVPHLADDAYVRAMAELIHARLAPGLRVWIEHSNETWNGGFPQAWHVQDEGLAAGLSKDAWQAGWFWHARRSVRIFEIFSEVFAGGRPLVRVMGGFQTVPWGNEQALSFEDAYLETDVLAIAPYFGHEWGTDRLAETRGMNATQLVNALRSQSLPWVLDLAAENRALADSYGVGLVAYEGGHHLNAPQLGWNDPVHALFHQAARSPAMGALYADYLASWRAIAGGTFVNFTLCGRFTQWGCWSLLEWITQASTPREQALVAFGAIEPPRGCGTTTCRGDVDGDGAVGPMDVAALLGAWGTPSAAHDLDASGAVDAGDLAVVLFAWGACDG